jgi:excisionase family DNA binding protein
MTEPFDVIAELSSRRKALTVMEFANLLAISKQSAYEQIKRGSLPALQLGNTIRLNPKDVARWLQARQTVEVPLRRAA